MAKSIGSSGNVELLDDGLEIEVISSDKDLRKIAADEQFANQVLEILVHASSDEREMDRLVLNVGGVNMPIMKGVKTKLKRKFVEVLARMKQTKYGQRTINPMEPDRIQMVPTTTQAHPFAVYHDPHPKGAAWLEAILRER
jgi:hypothetical protein